MQNKKVGLQQPPLPPIFEDLPHPHNGVWVKNFFSKKCVSGGVTTIHSHMVACASVLARLGKNLRGGCNNPPPFVRLGLISSQGCLFFHIIKIIPREVQGGK